MKFFSKYLLLLGVLCVAFVGCVDEQVLSTQELLNRALNNASKGRWEKALASLGIVCERERNNTSALIFKALAYEGCGKEDLALQTARLAVKNAPNDFWAQYTLGRLYAKDSQKMQDAITPLLRALRIRSNDRSSLLLLGRCSSMLKLDSAIKYYRRLAQDKKIKNRAELWNEMGIYYAERKEIRQAAACFVKAYKLSPLKPLIVLNLATFMDQYVGEPKRALKFYKKYLKITVSSPAFDRQRQRVAERIKELNVNG